MPARAPPDTHRFSGVLPLHRAGTVVWQYDVPMRLPRRFAANVIVGLTVGGLAVAIIWAIYDIARLAGCKWVR